MRISTVVICAFVIGGALALAGCGHKLVAHNGDSTVAVYPDEDTFVKLVNLKKQGGVGGMIGGLGEGLAAKQVDNNTPAESSAATRKARKSKSSTAHSRECKALSRRTTYTSFQNDSRFVLLN